MEHYFSIAGAVVKISCDGDKLFTDAGGLENFRVSAQPWDHEVFCDLTDEMPAPEGKMVFSDPGRLVFETAGGTSSWIGPVQQSYADAHIWVRREKNTSTALFLRRLVGDRIGIRSVLNALESEHLAVIQGGFLLHGSCICHKGKAIVFTAPSGTGKSTQAELWRIHRNVTVINGDRIMLRSGQYGWEAVGIPFCGSSGIRENRILPLAAVVALSQAPVTAVAPLTGVRAFRKIWEGCTLQTWNRQDVDRCAGYVEALLGSVPVFHLACTPDISAVEALEAVLNQ